MDSEKSPFYTELHVVPRSMKNPGQTVTISRAEYAHLIKCQEDLTLILRLVRSKDLSSYVCEEAIKTLFPSEEDLDQTPEGCVMAQDEPEEVTPDA